MSGLMPMLLCQKLTQQVPSGSDWSGFQARYLPLGSPPPPPPFPRLPPIIFFLVSLTAPPFPVLHVKVSSAFNPAK